MADVKVFNDPTLKLSLATMLVQLQHVAPNIFEVQQIARQDRQPMKLG